MKKIIIVSIILISNIAFGQNEKVKYDSFTVDYVLSQWNNNGKNQNSKFNQIELNQIKEFYQELRKGNNNICSDNFLKKPSDNTLTAYYLNLKLKWNMFNPAVGMKRLKNEKVIKKTLKNLPNRYELLAFYYKAIFINLLNNQDLMDLGKKNIDLDSLNLADETEKSIVFLCAMRHLGVQVTSYCSGPNFPKNCFRGQNFVNKMPKFNDKFFYEFELSEFEDFPIEIDKRYSKVSFKKRFITDFENAKNSYNDCLNNKKN